jgi:taurine dioxygenase
MGANLGMEVGGVTLLNADDATFQAVRAALDEHAVLLLREQALAPEELVEVTSRFGEPERFSHERAYPERPEVCIITSDARQAAAQPIYWHSDGAQQPEPPTTTLFYAVRTLPVGGETLFTDARDAYDTLPDELREKIEGRTAVMRNGVEQPLVRLHEASGRPAVYADFGQTVGIAGYDRAEAKEVFAALRAHVSRPETTYAHDWRPGDLVVWDNVAVVHSATRPPPSEDRRIMWRTTVRGEPAVAA